MCAGKQRILNEKKASCTGQCRTARCPVMLDTDCTVLTKTNSKWIMDINIKGKSAGKYLNNLK